MDNAAAPTVLAGTVERVTFYNPESGFSVVRLRTRTKREAIPVVGTLPAVQPGEQLVVTGRWRTDPRHGAQFCPESTEVHLPSNADGIVQYLGSGLVRQIGPVLAARIVAKFGDRTLDVLDSDPTTVREVPGIGPQRAQSIAAAWQEHRLLRDIVAFLAQHRMDTRYAPRLLSIHGADALKILKANPYRLVGNVSGFSFASVDKLGRALGIRDAAPSRLQAAVMDALLQAAEQGHTRVEPSRLVKTAASLAGVDSDLVCGAVSQLLSNGAIAGTNQSRPVNPTMMDEGLVTADSAGVLDESGVAAVLGRLRVFKPDREPEARNEKLSTTGVGRVRVFEPDPFRQDLRTRKDVGLAGLIRAEQALARQLLLLSSRSGLPLHLIDEWLRTAAEGQVLSEEQRGAIRLAASSGCFVLTGGPGVGKTTTVRSLVRCFERLGRPVALAAPTGKAAKRLGDVTGVEARTVHRLLGVGPEGFRYGSGEPLPYDAVVVDEASMLDTSLARAVAQAIPPRGQLILVGDVDQLPSVGPGQVLRDVLESGRIPATRLDKVFRQAAESQIVVNAHRIRRGLSPELPAGEVLSRASDSAFVRATAGRIPAVAAEWATNKLPKLLGVGPEDVQTLAPLTRVCQTLNVLLQERLNPQRGQAERPHGALALRVGDRVIQTRNNYQLGVVNGDTGAVVGVDQYEVTVDFGDSRIVGYAAADVVDLDHAYCLTVHRAQGSEWAGVIVLMSSSFGPMLSRNLLYTAMTRARRAVVIIGDMDAVERAVAETRDQHRCTGLTALLSGE